MEVCYRNTYGTVCDDFWDDLDAEVICRNLGYLESKYQYIKLYCMCVCVCLCVREVGCLCGGTILVTRNLHTIYCTEPRTQRRIPENIGRGLDHQQLGLQMEAIGDQ